MKVLIIGAKGFVGAHLATTMRLSGHTVIENFLKINPSDDINVSHTTEIGRLLKTYQPDVCVNCSGSANVSGSFIDPLNDFLKNTCIVYEVLTAIRNLSPQTRFVHLSSAAVYGNPAILPISENVPVFPVSPYGYHKFAAEQFCRAFSLLYGLKTISLRIFSAYGPGLRKQLLWDVYQKWKQSSVISLFGNGNEERDFIFISDLCLAIETVIQRGEFNGEVINTASGNSIAVKNIVSMLLDELGGEVEVNFTGKARDGDPSCWRADIGSLKKLGFCTQVSIETGLRLTAQWQKENG